MKPLKESGIVGKIYTTLMSNEFETWHEDEFLDFVEGNDQTPGNVLLNKPLDAGCDTSKLSYLITTPQLEELLNLKFN